MSSFTSALLLFLTLQRSTSSILLHEAGQGYSTSLAILLGELLKQGFCLVTGLYQVQQDLNVRLPVTSRSSRREQLATACYEAKEAFKVFLSRAISREAWKVALPAALYVVQNNLYLYASSRLQPSTFQALWQLRLIPTAFLSQILLKRQLGVKRWLALGVILGGVITLQQTQTSEATMIASMTDRYEVIAIVALMSATVLSSLAGILLEKVFQQKETNLWIANFQLSTFSLAPAAFVLMVECAHSESILDPFQSFGSSLWPWVPVANQGIAGVLVALTTKYAGCIAGNISGIAAIAVTHLIEVVRGNHSVNPTGEVSFCVSFALIAAGVVSYTLLPAAATSTDVSSNTTSQLEGYSALENSSTMELPVSSAEEEKLRLSMQHDDDISSASSTPKQSHIPLFLIDTNKSATKVEGTIVDLY